MNARDAILARIRAKLPKAPEQARRAAVEQRIAAHPRNLIPARGVGDLAGRAHRRNGAGGGLGCRRGR